MSTHGKVKIMNLQFKIISRCHYYMYSFEHEVFHMRLPQDVDNP